MNRSVKITLIFGLLAIFFVPLTRFAITTLGFERKVAVLILIPLLMPHALFASLGSYFGIWNLFCWLLRDLRFSVKETIFLLLATILSLLSFFLIKDLIKTVEVMLISWLPGVVVGVILFWRICAKLWPSVFFPWRLLRKIKQLEELERKDSEGGLKEDR